MILGGAVIARADKGGSNGEVRLKTGLTGAAIQGKKPGGSADFRSSANNRSRLNVEAEQVNLADGTTLTVSVTHSGTTADVGSINLIAGHGELELNSQDGAVVPAIVSGDIVTVSNSGTAILAGVF